MDEMKVWRCSEGHVLGLVRRNGSGVTQLLVYRQAVDMGADEPAAPEVMAVVEGMVFDIRCSVCEAVRTWVPGEAAIQRLLAQVGRRLPPSGSPLKQGGGGDECVT